MKCDVVFLNAALAATVIPCSQAQPKLPFSTSGRDIVDGTGNKFLYQGTNWPGHLEAMIPEGLQYSSIHDIVQKIRDFGLNSVRLTYATQMVDEIYSKGHDTSLSDTLSNALGRSNGTKVLQQILQHNSQLSENTTRLQVYDAVAKELASQGIVAHLDNHVSKAVWCCLPGDGNGWFGERFFNVDNWVRGWSYMAQHASEKWPTFASVGLRNEVRNALIGGEPYDWYTWYTRMTQAAAAVHRAAPDALIFFGGIDSATNDAPLPKGSPLRGTLLTPSGGKVAYFDPSKLAYSNKTVLEIHKYDNFVVPYTGDCPSWKRDLYSKGFSALDGSAKYSFPIVMSEYGFGQDGETYKKKYNQCLLEFVRQYKFGFMQWALQGSYYLRQGKQDADEGWGLLDHSWSGTRSEVTVENSLDLMITAVR